jgi:hypothetical protein
MCKWPALKHLAQAIPAGCTRQGMATAPGRCRSPSMHHAPRTLDSIVGNPRSRSTPHGIAKARRSMRHAPGTLDGTVGAPPDRNPRTLVNCPYAESNLATGSHAPHTPWCGLR